jgi:hypothetical protein
VRGVDGTSPSTKHEKWSQDKGRLETDLPGEVAVVQVMRSLRGYGKRELSINLHSRPTQDKSDSGEMVQATIA